MNDKVLERVRADLDQWRARVDHLLSKANLGGMEARDQLHELGKQLEPAFEQARRSLDELAATGAGEARTLVKSLRAGWNELRRTYRDLSKENREERDRKDHPAGG